ncbi:Heterokaryon incompatibility protein 6, OR allele [Colletotrichum fructicola]|nr:Heterokaryon incompatibility protein 6, OR allele [Colletotrichum fructicola]
MSEKYQRSPEPPQQAVALRQASPRINSPNVLEYQYKPLALDKIRVLVLLPGEFSSPLQGYIVHGYYDRSACELSYEALSYTWGGQATPETFRVLQHPNENSSTEGRIIKIGKNLETALRHLRQTSGTRTIWCDAMCINQNDLDERAIQVRGMGDIYRRANRVVVWLGPETDTLYRAMQILKFLGSIFYYDFERGFG